MLARTVREVHIVGHHPASAKVGRPDSQDKSGAERDRDGVSPVVVQRFHSGPGVELDAYIRQQIPQQGYHDRRDGDGEEKQSPVIQNEPLDGAPDKARRGDHGREAQYRRGAVYGQERPLALRPLPAVGQREDHERNQHRHKKIKNVF